MGVFPAPPFCILQRGHFWANSLSELVLNLFHLCSNRSKQTCPQGRYRNMSGMSTLHWSADYQPKINNSVTSDKMSQFVWSLHRYCEISFNNIRKKNKLKVSSLLLKCGRFSQVTLSKIQPLFNTDKTESWEGVSCCKPLHKGPNNKATNTPSTLPHPIHPDPHNRFLLSSLASPPLAQILPPSSTWQTTSKGSC